MVQKHTAELEFHLRRRLVTRESIITKFHYKKQADSCPNHCVIQTDVIHTNAITD